MLHISTPTSWNINITSPFRNLKLILVTKVMDLRIFMPHWLVLSLSPSLSLSHSRTHTHISIFRHYIIHYPCFYPNHPNPPDLCLLSSNLNPKTLILNLKQSFEFKCVGMCVLKCLLTHVVHFKAVKLCTTGLGHVFLVQTDELFSDSVHSI